MNSRPAIVSLPDSSCVLCRCCCLRSPIDHSSLPRVQLDGPQTAELHLFGEAAVGDVVAEVQLRSCSGAAGRPGRPRSRHAGRRATACRSSSSRRTRRPGRCPGCCSSCRTIGGTCPGVSACGDHRVQAAVGRRRPALVPPGYRALGRALRPQADGVDAVVVRISSLPFADNREEGRQDRLALQAERTRLDVFADLACWRRPSPGRSDRQSTGAMSYCQRGSR